MAVTDTMITCFATDFSLAHGGSITSGEIDIGANVLPAGGFLFVDADWSAAGTPNGPLSVSIIPRRVTAGANYGDGNPMQWSFHISQARAYYLSTPGVESLPRFFVVRVVNNTGQTLSGGNVRILVRLLT